MRVLFVSHVSSMYGGARSLLDLIDGLSEKNVKCYMIIPAKGPIEEELKRREIKYSVIPLKSWIYIKKIPLIRHVIIFALNLLVCFVIALKAIFWKIDVIHTNSSIIPTGALAAFLSRKPHIWHIREFGKEDYGHSFTLGKQLSFGLMNKLSFCIILISEALRQKYLQYIPAQKLRMIYDAVSVQGMISNNIKPTIPTLAMIGWLYPGKGQIDAILALTELVKQNIKLKLKIVGGGDLDYSQKLRQAVAQNKIGKYVEFTGYVDDMAFIYKSADIILVCSQCEALGRVAIEGMLSKKPVIGARSGATPELIKEGFNGLLYEPGNHQELAEKIKYLIKHPEEAKQMGENGFREASEKYAIAKYANEIYNIFQRAVEKRN